ncbi:hypothetical protein D3C80_1862170 [compost metagenome]
MQRIQLRQAFRRERPPRRVRFRRHVAGHALNDVPGLLQVQRHFDDFRPAARIFLAQILFLDLRQVQLDGGIQHVDIVV